MSLPIKTLQRTCVSARPSGYGASIVVVTEENHVRIVLDMVVYSFEEFNRLLVMRMPSPRRLRLTRPINRHILSVSFLESLPVLLFQASSNIFINQRFSSTVRPIRLPNPTFLPPAEH